MLKFYIVSIAPFYEQINLFKPYKSLRNIDPTGSGYQTRLR